MKNLSTSIALDHVRRDAHHETGKRLVGRLGEGEALVLLLESPYLQNSWQKYIDAGYQCTYPTFTPHITMAWDPTGFNRQDEIKPYQGDIILGGEVHGPVMEKWDDDNVVVKKPVLGSLYVRRNVLNPGDLMDWARSQNIVGRVNHGTSLHATLVYSKNPIMGHYEPDTRVIVNRGISRR